MATNNKNILVYDPQTKKGIRVDSVSAQKGLLSGAYLADANTHYNFVDSKGESLGSLTGQDVYKGLDRGASLESARQARQIEEGKSITGALKVGALKAGSEALFGLPELAYEHLAPKADVEEWEEKKEAHPVASVVGSGLGFAANMAVGGELFDAAALAGRGVEGAVLGGRAAQTAAKAAEGASIASKAAEGASIAGKAGQALNAGRSLAGAATETAPGFGRKLLASAAKMGTEGAVISAPQVVTEAALGDPKEAAEHLFYGIGSGAMLGLAAPIFKGAGREILRAAGKPIGLDIAAANPLEKMVENQTIRSLMYGTDKRALKLAETANGGTSGLSKWVHENGLVKNVNEHFEDYANRINTKKEEVGGKIGDLYAQLDEAGARGLTTPEISARIRSEVIDPLKRKAGRSAEVSKLEGYLGELKDATAFQTADRLGVDVVSAEAKQTARAVKADLAAWEKLTPEAQAEMENTLAGKTVKELENEPVHLNDLWATRKTLDSKIYEEGKASTFGNLTPLEKEYSKIRNLMQEAVEEHANSALDGKFSTEIKALNHDYKQANTVAGIVKRSAESETTRRAFSLTDHMMGLGEAALHAGSALCHPLGAISGLAAMYGNKFMRENANAVIAKYGNQVSLYLADKAKMEAEQQIGKIPGIMSKMIAGAPPVRTIGMNAFSHFLGRPDEKISDDNAIKEISQHLAAAEDPAKHIGSTVDMLSNGAPQIAEQYKAQNQAVLDYLKQNVPTDPNPPAGFGAPKWTPSKAEVKDFRDKVSIINNPLDVVDLLASGRLNQNHMQALKAAYPAVYSRIVAEITSAAGHKKVPYSKRMQISMLIGQPLDPSLNIVGELQKTFADSSTQESGPKPAKLKNLTGSSYSTMQKKRST
jgi:hypothetical protein